MVGFLRPGRLRFDRNEFAGAFGDIGTSFPLLTGMILAADLHPTGVLVMFGAMQILTGVVYGLPIPVQPLKAMAVIVITQRLAPAVLFGGGLAIGVLMLILALTGLVEWVARVVPKSVVRGIQFGLGLQLASLALTRYVSDEGTMGWILAAVCFVVTVALLGNRRFPPALLLIAGGMLYALAFRLDPGVWARSVGFHLPEISTLSVQDVLTGFFVLTIPQLPLSLGNSVLATTQVVSDHFPQQPVTVRRISLTYAVMNLINPWFGGVPTCHGSGGVAGYYAFGARTGGSVVIAGTMYLLLGLVLSSGFGELIRLFPLPVLGVILLFEALALLRLARDITDPIEFALVLLVGVIVLGVPYGYAVGLVVGTILVRLRRPHF
jgi:hypothetical protein